MIKKTQERMRKVSEEFYKKYGREFFEKLIELLRETRKLDKQEIKRLNKFLKSKRRCRK